MSHAKFQNRRRSQHRTQHRKRSAHKKAAMTQPVPNILPLYPHKTDTITIQYSGDTTPTPNRYPGRHRSAANITSWGAPCQLQSQFPVSPTEHSPNCRLRFLPQLRAHKRHRHHPGQLATASSWWPSAWVAVWAQPLGSCNGVLESRAMDPSRDFIKHAKRVVVKVHIALSLRSATISTHFFRFRVYGFLFSCGFSCFDEVGFWWILCREGFRGLNWRIFHRGFAFFSGRNGGRDSSRWAAGSWSSRRAL
jgi:hypothetical protein